jgi:hypothetical protein
MSTQINPPPTAGEDPADAMSWSAIAGEFLQEHWQKLILCLGVLLIVVSSTAGAHHLLGPLLLLPEGKCLLALVYTLLLGFFGYGLIRWGAEVAGRIVLLTTLIVVPINFSLAGELRMLTEPSLSRLLVLALVTIVLCGASTVIARALAPQSRMLLPLTFFVLSALNAIVSPGINPGTHEVGGWGLAALLAPGFLYLGAVFRENRRYRSSAVPGGADARFLSLGVLTYAFLFGVLRSGHFVLHLLPTLYALPAMLVGIAGVDAAAHCRNRANDSEGTREAGVLLLTGQLLAALAFALALSRPPEPSPLFSGNTLATALLGLALFATSLRRTRQPVYLYLSFGALFLAYFGAGYFIGDLSMALEDAARRALGYQHRLPLPFKALNGIVFNAVLAALALLFSRRWREPDLERHCHLIGLPVALAACLLSSFEPKAAVLCLMAYAPLFAVAAWLFARPFLVYLACAAACGSVYFASTLVPHWLPDAKALGAAGIGVGFWCIQRILLSRGAPEPYRMPLTHAALFTSAAAMGLSLLCLFTPAPSLVVALAFLVLAGLYFAVHADQDWQPLPHLAITSLAAAFGVTVWHGLAIFSIRPLAAVLAVALAGFALMLYQSGTVISRRAHRATMAPVASRFDAIADRFRLSSYGVPLQHVSLVLIGITWLLCAGAGPSLTLVGVALALTTACLVLVVSEHPCVTVAHLAAANGMAVWLCLVRATAPRFGASPEVMAAPCFSGLAILLFALLLLTTARVPAQRVECGRHDVRREGAAGTAGLWLASLPDASLAAVASALVLVVWEPNLGLDVSLALDLAAVGFLWQTRFRRWAALVYLSLGSAVLAALATVSWGTDWRDPGHGLGCLALVLVVAALALWSVGTLCQRKSGDGFYSIPSFEVARLLAVGTVPIALAAVLVPSQAWLLGAAVLGLDALAFLLLTSVWRDAWLTYAAAAAFVGAAHLVLDSTVTRGGAYVSAHGLLTAVLALALWLIGFLGRRRTAEEQERIYWRPLFTTSLGLTLLAVPLSLASLPALVLVALGFLLAVRSFPAAGWLYAVVGLLAWAARLMFLPEAPDKHWVVASIAAAYGLWGLGLLVQTWRPVFCRRLGLRELGYEYPLFNTALVAAAFALLLWVGGSVWRGEAWTAHLVLLPTLALFSLLMLRPYPSRGWVHVSVALLTLAVVLKASPLKLNVSPGWWVVLGLALAHVWQIACFAVVRIEARVCRWCGIDEDRYSEVPGSWALVLSKAGVALIIVVVTAGVLGQVFDIFGAFPCAAVDWWPILAAQVLAMGCLFLNRSRLTVDRWLMLFHGGVLLLVWWLGVSESIVVRLGSWSLSGYHPLTTVVFSLYMVALSARRTGSGSGSPSFGSGEWSEDARTRLAASAGAVAVELLVLAVGFTKGEVTPTTVITLALATLVAAWLTVAHRRPLLVYAGGGLFVTACLYLFLVMAASLRGSAGTERVVAAAVGLVAGASVLFATAGRLRAPAVGARPRAGERGLRMLKRAASRRWPAA